MTKKDFIRLANLIKYHNVFDCEPFTVTQLTTLANFCREQNPNFNTQLWLDYIAGKVGPNGGKVKS